MIELVFLRSGQTLGKRIVGLRMVDYGAERCCIHDRIARTKVVQA